MIEKLESSAKKYNHNRNFLFDDRRFWNRAFSFAFNSTGNTKGCSNYSRGLECERDQSVSQIMKIQQLGLSMESENLEETLILASLIQEEIKDPFEMRIGAGILKKRLEAGIPLQIDTTLCYLKGVDGMGCLPITQADKALDSPYNTYLYRGLPPGPISNPGLDAIRATLNPANSPYLYYVSDPKTGRTIFGKTLDEHNQNVIKYLSE